MSNVGVSIFRRLRVLRRERSWLTPRVWKARDEWMDRAAREAVDPLLAEIRALPEAGDKDV